MKPQEFRKTLRLVGICFTPFDKDRQFDVKAMVHHTKWMVERGINKENGCLVIGGSCGECGAMSDDERKKVLDTTLDAVGDKVPVVLCCNHTNVYQTISLAQYAEKAGAAGIMLLTPYYFKATDKVALEFFKKVSDSMGLGIYLYNHPWVTQLDISVETMVELAETTNVVGIKECTPDFFKMIRMCAALKDKISITSGNGEFWEPYTHIEGCTGFISSLSNVAPELATRMWKAVEALNIEETLKIRRIVAPLFDAMGRFGAVEGEPKVIALMKKWCDLVGSIGGYGRLPVPELTKEESEDARQVLVKVGLL